MKAPLINSADLKHAARDLETPFRIRINAAGSDGEFTCTRSVRLVPGRRLVCFGTWRGQDVVAKFFLDRRRGNYHLEREAAGLAALASARVAAPAVIFRAMVPPDGPAVLGLRRLPAVVSFGAVWRRCADDAQRRALLRQVVVLLADQHQAGIKQDDLHGENFLLSGSQLFVVDGASVDHHRLGTPLREKASLQNLAVLLAALLPESDRLVEDAFEKYTRRRSWRTAPRLLQRLQHELRKQAERQLRAWLKKIRRESTDYVCRRSWRRDIMCTRGDYTPGMAAFLDDPDPVVERGRWIKDGNSATVALVAPEGRQLIVKRYKIKNGWHRLRRCLRASRAEISWENAHLLGYVRVPTPRPVAFVVRRWGPFRSTAYFICEYVKGPDAHTLLHAPDADPRSAEKLAARFGEIMQSLAGQRICHGDLKATNFIAADDRLWVVDLDAMRRFRCARRFRRAFANDLDRLMRNWIGLPAIEEIFRRSIETLRRSVT
jgi:tRNA A-37 threonylcarbamoyl transferase component Bud32